MCSCIIFLSIYLFIVLQSKTAKKQDLSDEADQYNPQTNKNMKKQQKMAQKKKQKQTKKPISMAIDEDDADYNFATDYAQDIDLDEIDTDD